MNPLNEPIRLNSGAIIPNRIVMAPMTSKGSSWDGMLEQEDFDFYSRRSQAAGLIITGATAVSELGENFSYQMSIYDDCFIPGFTELAKRIKRHGSKTVVQLYHSGANSKVSFRKHGMVVGPSDVHFPHLPYAVTALTEEGIWEIIKDYGRATKRVITAGFDGVEIHGAYSHIIQQFFSVYSNKRQDHWGGTLERRMNFLLEVINEVQRVAKECGKDEFIIGYRHTEEEIHWKSVGYRLNDTLQLFDKIADTGIDYIHVITDRYGKQIKDVIAGRTAFIFVPHALTAEEAAEGLAYGDMVSFARAILIEPDFAKKVQEGRESEIATEITSIERAKDLCYPKKLIDWLFLPYGGDNFIGGMHFFKD
ncbi:NADH-dependent flavin oxidoreductase [Terribacillus saccharophilus]|uniref:oxidoreductase n=1 Tax=Terribacillus saccharophilus TaxID=361277 RepID=UPI003D2B87F2